MTNEQLRNRVRDALHKKSSDCAMKDPENCLPCMARANIAIRSIQSELDFLEGEVALLNALRSAGVDNWEGYSYAFQILNGEELI